MLLQFVIEPAALGELVHRGNWGTFLASLESFWHSHGVLVMPDDFDEHLDRSGLDRYRISQWRTFIKDGPKRVLPKNDHGVDWVEAVSWDDLKEHIGEFELALLQQTHAGRFGLVDENEHCTHDPSGHVPIEITRGEHILFTCQSKKMQNLGRSAVAPEETPQQVWAERLRSHVKHSTSVLLVDIYAALRWEGLQLFLEKLVFDGRQPGQQLQSVHVYSAYRNFRGTGPESAAGIKAELRNEAKRLGAGLGSTVPSLDVQIHLFHQDDLPNDRWLRLDDNIIDLGHGLEVLESNRSQAFGFHLSVDDYGRQRQETGLQSFCRNHRDDEAITYGSLSVSVCTRDHRRRLG